MTSDFLVAFGMGAVCLALSLVCWKFAVKRQNAEDDSYARRHDAGDLDGSAQASPSAASSEATSA